MDATKLLLKLKFIFNVDVVKLLVLELLLLVTRIHTASFLFFRLGNRYDPDFRILVRLTMADL